MKDKVMHEATFIRKYHGSGYRAYMVYLDYSYRGHEYTVYENLAQGNEPLIWQHHNAQSRIDQLIERQEQDKKIDRVIELQKQDAKPYRHEDTADYAFDELMKFFNGEPSDFD